MFYSPSLVLCQMPHRLQRPLRPVRLRNPTVSCSAAHPAPSSNQQVLCSDTPELQSLMSFTFSDRIKWMGFIFSGLTLSESGRSDSRTTLRLPKEDRLDITQIRKVHASCSKVNYASVWAFLQQLNLLKNVRLHFIKTIQIPSLFLRITSVIHSASYSTFRGLKVILYRSFFSLQLSLCSQKYLFEPPLLFW